MTDTQRDVVPERRAIHAFTSVDAHEQWHEFALEHGVSVSAMLEAIAGCLSTSFNPNYVEKPVEVRNAVKGIARAARLIDSERRRRGGVQRKS